MSHVRHTELTRAEVEDDERGFYEPLLELASIAWYLDGEASQYEATAEGH